MISFHHEIFGRKYGEDIFIPISAAGGHYRTYISGYSAWTLRVEYLGVNYYESYCGNPVMIDFYDNPVANSTNSSAVIDYPTNAVNGAKAIFKGLNNNNVYSFCFGEYYGNINNCIYISSFKDWIGQFTKLYSFVMSPIHSNIGTIIGNLADIPDSLEKIKITNTRAGNGLFLDVTSFSNSSSLKIFNQTGASPTLLTYGNLAKLPSQLYYFKLNENSGTFTYSGTKVWTSSFDTLDLGNAILSTTETDNLLIDMANSITTAIGSKIIRLANCYRTSASNTAVAYLQSLGFTITVAGIAAKILDLPLQNNFTDTTGINTMIAGDTSNLPTFTLEGGEYAATFNGSQSIKTNANFNLNSDKVSISFWLKTSQKAVAIIVELSPNTNSNNAFSAYLNDNVANSVQFNSQNTGSNQSARTGANNGTWKHFVAVIDRSKNGANEILIYENGSLVTFTKPFSTDNNGIFGIYPLFIGQRGGSSLGFNGQMKFLKIFNYPLSTTEITNIYNKTM